MLSSLKGLAANIKYKMKLLKAYNTGYSQAVTQPSTYPARQDLTSVIGREPVFSLWCGRRRNKLIQLALILNFSPICINNRKLNLKTIPFHS